MVDSRSLVRVASISGAFWRAYARTFLTLLAGVLGLCLAASYPVHASDAVPLGLIVNELITNAQKYAFPAGGTGTIEVTLEKTVEGLRLTVSDNGFGVQDKVHGSGLGHRLVRALVHQLGGSVQF